MLVADYRYRLDGEEIVIPRGFVTDFASVPGMLHSWLGPHGRYSRAAIVHDFLYCPQPCTRQQADNILRRIMVESGVDTLDRAGASPPRPSFRIARRGFRRPRLRPRRP